VTAGRRFNEVAVTVHAESVVIESRITDVAAANKAAQRRTSAARGQVTRAMRDGNATMIAEARAGLRPGRLAGQTLPPVPADKTVTQVRDGWVIGLVGTMRGREHP
jgi:hypothetical protein